MRKKRQKQKELLLKRLYHFFVTFPERTYPFATRIRGKKVRWGRSYERAVRDIQERLGEGACGIKLGTYRQLWHIIGSALFIGTATLLSHTFIGTDAALPAMFFAAMIAITYQEFYFHPRYYKQRFGKSIADWASWVAPLYLYLAFVLP